MQIIFNNLIMHNFLSYCHSEINLQDKKYCLVSGINLNPQDKAKSNGAGKSSMFSAICWALTGETIQGRTSDVKNINIDEDSCYVSIDFNIDQDNYKITRYKNPKSDLRIELNGVDISGKGIRESEQILSDYIPDLTSQLIGSIIILGQGLPAKFTSNTPSGRKEVLERLSKSDFMIEDLKIRLQKRQDELTKDLRKYEDAILADTAQKAVLTSEIEKQQEEYNRLNQPQDFDARVKELQEKISGLSDVILKHQNKISELNIKNASLNESLNKNNNDKAASILSENNLFNEFKAAYIKRSTELNINLENLTAEIAKAKNITDICPTCGQKIPNVHKIDTTELEVSRDAVKEVLENTVKKYEANKADHESRLKQIEDSYATDISKILFGVKTIKDQLDIYSKDLANKNQEFVSETTELNKIRLEQENYSKTLQLLKSKLHDLTLAIKKLDDNILYNNNEKQIISNRLAILNQLNSLIKRDFRGYLLSNVISFISRKAKEYAIYIFGTDELDFELNGNNIDISYCKKAFENLSGGEKQRVDLIIQFAIRDMMRQYLGFSSNILVLDEVFDALDSIGCSNVINLISNKLSDVESIFIISHRADELAIPYDSELTIIKDAKGISRLK